MANKPLQSIQFPGLPDTYTVPQVDSSFTGVSGKVPDSKKVYDEIEGVKENLSDKVIAMTSGYILAGSAIGDTADLTPQTSQTYRYAVLDCNAGDVFEINCTGSSTIRPWYFLDVNNEIIGMPGSNMTLTDRLLTAPTGAKKLVLNDSGGGKSYVGETVNRRFSDLEYYDGCKKNTLGPIAINQRTPLSARDFVPFDSTKQSVSVSNTGFTLTTASAKSSYYYCFYLNKNAIEITSQGLIVFAIQTANFSSNALPWVLAVSPSSGKIFSIAHGTSTAVEHSETLTVGTRNDYTARVYLLGGGKVLIDLAGAENVIDLNTYSFSTVSGGGIVGADGAKLGFAYKGSSKDFTIRTSANGGYWSKKQWHVIGDSISYGTYSKPNTSIERDTTIAFTAICNGLLGYDMTNHAVPGLGFAWDSIASGFSGVSLTDVLAESFTGAELVTVSLGTNDYGHDATLGTIEDTSSDATVYGRIKLVIETMQTKCPSARLVFTTPIPRSTAGTASTQYCRHTDNTAGYSMDDVRQAIIDVCEYYGIEYIDMQATCPINYFNKDVYLYDGLHPSIAGHALLGKWFASKIVF